MAKQLVAVYGTLREGNGNHVLLEHEEKLSTERVSGFKMYSLGGFPAILPTGNEEDRVTIEVYEVDDETLARLDRLEGYPGWYERSVVHTTLGGALIYHFTEDMIRPHFPLIEGGNWNEYRAAIRGGK